MNRFAELFDYIKRNRLLLISAAAVLIAAIAAVLIFTGNSADTVSIDDAGAETSIANDDPSVTSKSGIYVDVSGCVKKPGVYEAEPDSRVFEVIEKAGGFTEDADTSTLNQAERVTDGLKIFIPDKNDQAAPQQSTQQSSASAAAEGIININTADSTALQEIPGVGPVTAEKIISYRNENGAFRSPEDLKNVSGIGEKTFEKIKPHITC